MNPTEKKLRRLLRRLKNPFSEFFQYEASGGIVLLASAFLAILLANSPLSELYQSIWNHEFGFYLGEDLIISKSLIHWINDGLMTVFFLHVGLEIKREMVDGELSSLKKSALPLMAALGGMTCPAIIFFIFNKGTDAICGWGVPVATDIAFSLGVLSMLGRKVPTSIKVFLAAFAIFDDIGGVLIIAIFYTGKIYWTALAIGAALIVFLFILNNLGAKSLKWYLFFGFLGWLAFLKSGVHSTVMGVLLATTIPMKVKMIPSEVVELGKELLEEFREACDEDHELAYERRHTALASLGDLRRYAMSPLVRLEHALNPIVTFIVLPVFAFANAGIVISSESLAHFFEPVTFGIIAALFFGNPIGICSFSFIAVKLGIGELPDGVKWKHIVGVSVLGGIGFTMSIFIASLAYADPAVLAQAKLGVIAGSLISGVLGFFIIRFLVNGEQEIEE